MYYRRCVMITLRINRELEKKVENVSKTMGISKSALVRNSLIEYLIKYSDNNAWKAGKDLFGKYKSGNSDLSVSTSTTFREKIRRKHKNE